MLCFDFIGVINQVNVLFFTHIFKVCIYLLTFLTKFLVVSSQDDVWYDDITVFAFHMKDYMIRVFSQRRFYVIVHATCCCVWKMLDKNLAVTLNFFFDISQPFTCLSILSPNITINFWLFELMSQLLIDELSSLLSAFSLVDALSAFFCNGVDCFGSMCVIFLFSFFTLSLSIYLSLSLSISQSLYLYLSISLSLYLFNWDSFGSDKQVFCQGHLVSHIAFLLTSIKDFWKFTLKFLSQVNC